MKPGLATRTTPHRRQSGTTTPATGEVKVVGQRTGVGRAFRRSDTRQLTYRSADGTEVRMLVTSTGGPGAR